MKKEIRVLGIDDAPFDKFSDRKTRIFGTIFRGGDFCDGVLSDEVTVDGEDATKIITDMILNCKFKPQLRAILLDGIAVGGFNVIDIHTLNSDTGIPVIVIMREHPRLEDMKKTLEKLGMAHKIEFIDMAGEALPAGDVLIQIAGIEYDEAKEIVKLTSTHSNIPEPIRLAHLIGQGFALGESKGRA